MEHFTIKYVIRSHGSFFLIINLPVGKFFVLNFILVIIMFKLSIMVHSYILNLIQSFRTGRLKLKIPSFRTNTAYNPSLNILQILAFKSNLLLYYKLEVHKIIETRTNLPWIGSSFNFGESISSYFSSGFTL